MQLYRLLSFHFCSRNYSPSLWWWGEGKDSSSKELGIRNCNDCPLLCVCFSKCKLYSLFLSYRVGSLCDWVNAICFLLISCFPLVPLERSSSRPLPSKWRAIRLPSPIGKVMSNYWLMHYHWGSSVRLGRCRQPIVPVELVHNSLSKLIELYYCCPLFGSICFPMFDFYWEAQLDNLSRHNMFLLSLSLLCGPVWEGVKNAIH